MSEWGTCRKKPIMVQFREVQKKSMCWDINESPDKSQVWGEYIDTKEGRMFANSERDYIIRGIQGEEYPIKKDIFTQTYDIIQSKFALKGKVAGGEDLTDKEVRVFVEEYEKNLKELAEIDDDGGEDEKK